MELNMKKEKYSSDKISEQTLHEILLDIKYIQFVEVINKHIYQYILLYQYITIHYIYSPYLSQKVATRSAVLNFPASLLTRSLKASFKAFWKSVLPPNCAVTYIVVVVE